MTLLVQFAIVLVLATNSLIAYLVATLDDDALN